MRQLVRHHSMNPKTVRSLVKEDLDVIIQRPLLTPNAQEMRKKRCQKLLNKLKGFDSNQVRNFPDEKIFTGVMTVNRCNSRCLTDLHAVDVDPSILISLFFNTPLKQMVLGCGQWQPEMPYHFQWHQQMTQCRCLSGPSEAARDMSLS